MPKEIKVCQNPLCGNEFEHYASNGKGLYCSKDCYAVMKSHGIVLMECPVCKKEFSRLRKDATKSKVNYCSKDCRNSSNIHLSHRRKRVIVKCDYCGLDVERIPYRISLSNKQFCNKTCHSHWMSELGPKGSNHHSFDGVLLHCSNCGEGIYREKSYAKRYKDFFCGPQCRAEWQSINFKGDGHPNWQGGYPGYRGPNIRNQKDLARKRDNYTCQRCGIVEIDAGRRLDVHHIRPFIDFGYIRDVNDNYLQANDLSNLISLCQECHIIVERELRKSD